MHLNLKDFAVILHIALVALLGMEYANKLMLTSRAGLPNTIMSRELGLATNKHGGPEAQKSDIAA